jgi:hypothetical protein
LLDSFFSDIKLSYPDSGIKTTVGSPLIDSTIEGRLSVETDPKGELESGSVKAVSEVGRSGLVITAASGLPNLANFHLSRLKIY